MSHKLKNILLKIINIGTIYLFIKSIIIYKYYSHKFKKVDYFDYKTLANLKFTEPMFFRSCCHYGNYKAIAKFKGSRFNFLTEYLEHGISFRLEPENVIDLGYINRPFIKKVYTYGELRKASIEEYLKINHLKRKIITIGPYIKYVDFFKSKEDLLKIKQQYGKILLVFPSHGINTVKSQYDVNEFINAINDVKDNFDTVFISLHWVDVIDGLDVLYKKHGFITVTSGSASDPYFLNRHKDLIFLSDHTMSNNLGSYIGYSICMEKPHYLYKQETHYISTESEEEIKPAKSHYDALYKFQKHFSTFSTEITKEQIELVEQYWGKW